MRFGLRKPQRAENVAPIIALDYLNNKSILFLLHAPLNPLPARDIGWVITKAPRDDLSE